jgi:hypothetical protein
MGSNAARKPTSPHRKAGVGLAYFRPPWWPRFIEPPKTIEPAQNHKPIQNLEPIQNLKPSRNLVTTLCVVTQVADALRRGV